MRPPRKRVNASRLREANEAVTVACVALERIREVTGTSTEAWHIADDALSAVLSLRLAVKS